MKNTQETRNKTANKTQGIEKEGKNEANNKN